MKHKNYTDGILYNGDCLKVLPRLINQGIKVDAVICDVPYGTTACQWDSIIPFEDMWNNLNLICKKNAPIVLFSAQPFTTNLIVSNYNKFKYTLVWKKNVPTGLNQAKYRPMRYHEDICIFNTNKDSTYNPIMKQRVGDKTGSYKHEHYCGSSHHVNLEKIKKTYDENLVQPSSVLEFNVVPNRINKYHPTQKPISLMEYLIKTYTNEGDIVLDFTCGSGSTLVACRNTKRRFIGIELNKSYYDICKKRLKSECRKSLF